MRGKRTPEEVGHAAVFREKLEEGLAKKIEEQLALEQSGEKRVQKDQISDLKRIMGRLPEFLNYMMRAGCYPVKQHGFNHLDRERRVEYVKWVNALIQGKHWKGEWVGKPMSKEAAEKIAGQIVQQALNLDRFVEQIREDNVRKWGSR